MMSRSCGVGQNLKAQENWGGDNHTRDLISETGMMESLHAISSCVLIAADAASQCQTRTKTLCKLLLPAAVQVSTSGQACSQDKKMYSKKKKMLPTQTHPVHVEYLHRDAQLDPSRYLVVELSACLWSLPCKRE